ncbi:hypothetical protein ACLB2K_014153 [Fragaria x ananassa]
MAGRTQLVQSVFQSMLLHSFSVYHWPVYLVKKLTSWARNFIWSGNIGTRKIVTIRWAQVCAPKLEGGLGIRDLSSLLILSCYPKVCLGFFLFSFSMGGLRSVKDKWLQAPILETLGISNWSYFSNLHVADFISHQSWQLPPFFCQAFLLLARQISDLALPLIDESDMLICEPSTSGELTFSVGYDFLRHHNTVKDWACNVWRSFIPPRYSFLVWRILFDRLPTDDRVKISGIPIVTIYFWKSYCQKLFSSQLFNLWLAAGMFTFIALWKARNKLRFDNRTPNFYTMCCSIMAWIREISLFPPGHYKGVLDARLLASLGVAPKGGKAPRIQHVLWQPPFFPWIKVNTDGLAKGNPGPAACGGVFRDASGDLFTLKIHHGGRFFNNKGSNREYRGGEVLYLDSVDPDKVSLPELNNWAWDLGYQSGPIGYWFQIPGSELGTGYVPIIHDPDVQDMCGFVTSTRMLDFYIVCLAERKIFLEEELSVFQNNIDHVCFMGHVIDDVQEGSDAIDDVHEVATNGDRAQAARKKAADKEKQKVVEEIVPAKRKKTVKPKKSKAKRYSTRSAGESSNASAPRDEFIAESESSTDSDDPNFDGIIDSDFADLTSDDDDVQFNNNVDGDIDLVNELVEMGFEGAISEDDRYDSDGEESLHGSNDEGVDRGRFPVKCRKRYSQWREFKKKHDMKNPEFVIGMAFANSREFKSAIRKHAVVTKKELRFPTNSRHKMVAKCFTSEDCLWRIYASSTNLDNPTIYIRTLKQEHTCTSLNEKVYHMHAPFIAEKYEEFFLNDPKWSTEGIQNTVNKDFGMKVGYQMAYRARLQATKRAQGSYADQYNLLESYAHELKKRNLGTSV